MEVSIGVQMFAVFSLRRWVWGWVAHGSIAISATAKAEALQVTVWFLVGNGGMDYGDYYGGLYRDYYRDPFPTKHQGATLNPQHPGTHNV